jgi:L-amino acid N-acyltransferase YncA
LKHDGGAATVGIMIRRTQEGDGLALARIYASSVIESATSFEAVAPSAEEMEARAARYQPWLVHVEGGEVLGYAYASPHSDRAAYRWSVDSTVYIDARAHRRGVGRALYTALFTLLRAQGYCAVHAGITLPNAASVGLHEAMGFRPVGVYPKVGWKLAAWRDVGWWQLELRPRQGEPPRLRRPDELTTEEWSAALSGP